MCYDLFKNNKKVNHFYVKNIPKIRREDENIILLHMVQKNIHI